MKEATGEFSMTVVTILAVIVLVGIVGWLSPKIVSYVKNQWNKMAVECPSGQYYDSASGQCKKVG